MKLTAKPYLLRNNIQYYKWGCTGPEAYIPRLLELEEENRTELSDTSYAELWIGAHRKSPSLVYSGDDMVTLDILTDEYPAELLGERVFKKFGSNFPFLLKILSAKEPLSIQVHPDKSLAQHLHKKDPENYPDSNHKPEIAVALDSLQALSGFRASAEIEGVLHSFPALSALLNCTDITRTGLKEVLNDLISVFAGNPSRAAQITAQIEKMITDKPAGQRDRNEEVFLSVCRKYPGDIGLIFVLLLNVVNLSAGEAIFLEAGVPHAYLKGNIVECMAASDNVIRAGLTPKFKDAAALVEALRYGPGPGIIKPPVPDATFEYPAPAGEFSLSRVIIGKGQTEVRESGGSVEVFGIISGEAELIWKENRKEKKQALNKGKFILIPAVLNSYRIDALSGVQMFRVSVP